MTTMTDAISITDVAANAVALYETKRGGRPMPLMLIGPPGHAKSSIVEGPLAHTLAAHYGCTVEVITDMPAQRDAPDYKGFLVPTKTAEGTPVSRYTKPDLVYKVEQSTADIVVLFFDEILGADHLVQKALTDVMLNGRLGEYVLPEHVWIVGASNRQQDGAAVNRALTILTNRLVTLNVHLPLWAWVKHAEELRLPATGLAFAKFKPGIVFTQEAPTRDGPFSSPRSYTDALRHLSVKKALLGDTDPMTLPSDPFTRSVVTGSIGPAATTELYAYAQVYSELPTIREIEDDPEHAPVPPMHRLDAQFAAGQMLTTYANGDNIGALWTYAERLVRDLQASIVFSLMSNSFGGTLLNCKSLSKWIADPRNKALLSSSWRG